MTTGSKVESETRVVRVTTLAVRSVTVFEDRAHVTRRGSVRLPKGFSRVCVPEVSPILIDKTLLVGHKAGATCKLSAYRVERTARVVDRDKPIDIQALEQQIRQTQERMIHWERTIDRHQRDLKSARELGGRYIAEVALDAAWGQHPSDATTASLDRLLEAELDAAAQTAAAEAKLDDLKEQLSRLVAEKRAYDRVERILGADILMDLEASSESDVELVVEYSVPNACWRPWHCARLSGSPRDDASATLEFRTDATVWQNTGEDWRGVQLIFSTERPSQPKDPPRLEDDLLTAQKKGPAIVVETRETEIEKPGLGGPPRKPEAPGLDDGGEVRTITCAHPVDVPADGRPYRVELQKFETKAELCHILVAEVNQAVVLRATAVHEANVPILPGPVDLIKEGGPIGRGKLLFVAPGEKFSLSFGPDPDVVVHRDLTQLVTEAKVLSSWTTTPYKMTLRISNLVDTVKQIEVIERVPVSEIEKVTVAVDPKKTSDSKQPDADGFVKWDVRLGEREHRTLELVYAVGKHGDVVTA